GEHAAGWSSSVARRAHNPEGGGSNPPPATKVAELPSSSTGWGVFSFTMPSPQQLRKRNAHVPGDGKQLITPERHLAANPLRHLPLGKSQNLGNVCLSQAVPRHPRSNFASDPLVLSHTTLWRPLTRGVDVTDDDPVRALAPRSY